MKYSRSRLCSAIVFALVTASGVRAQEKSTEELAREAQNPVADVISIPFQNNFNFGYGPYGKLQYVLNIQPVVPFHITEDWNLITRTIMPVISQPQFTPFDNRESGLGDVNPTLFLSPQLEFIRRKMGRARWRWRRTVVQGRQAANQYPAKCIRQRNYAKQRRTLADKVSNSVPVVMQIDTKLVTNLTLHCPNAPQVAT